MEKLLKLLNEYRKEKGERNLNEFEASQTLDSLNYLRLFIKWLVDNDKIDVESYCRITSVERKWEKDVYRDEVDSLIMLLAIQDKPIEFLISILK